MYWLGDGTVVCLDRPLCRELALHLNPKWTAASDLGVRSPQPFSPDGEVDNEQVVVALKALPSSARCILLPPLPALPQLHLEAARISLVERAHIFAV